MRISVTDPIGPAFERTKRILFQPFNLSKWMTLGFCAFLASLGEGGGGGSGGTGGNPAGGQSQGGGPSPSDIADWIETNLAAILVIGALVLTIVLAIMAVLIWLTSRGKFMFLDGVARNRGAVVEPWRAFKPLANNLAGVRFLLAVISMGLILTILTAAAIIVWPDLKADRFGDRALVGLVFAVPAFLATGLVFGVIGALIEDFVVPAMYQFGMPCTEAWRLVMADVVRGRVGTIVLYFLMKIVLGLGIGIAAVVVVCATCCIAALPYIGTVILLPMYVFLRCYPLCFLEQLGPEWRIFADEPPAPQFDAPPAEPPPGPIEP
jgi:hypothetical protein